MLSKIWYAARIHSMAVVKGLNAGLSLQHAAVAVSHCKAEMPLKERENVIDYILLAGGRATDCQQGAKTGVTTLVAM